jgi:hypothetical protein
MNAAGHTLKDRIGIEVVRNKLNILNLNILSQNNIFNCIHRVDRMEAEGIPKRTLVHLEEQDALDARTYSRRINLLLRHGTDRKVQTSMLVDVFCPDFKTEILHKHFFAL